MKLLIQQGRLVDPVSGIGGILDILIEDSKIAVIASSISEPGAEILNASGLVVCAGLVDMHVHLREPGYEYKEDIGSGTKAAARGGFTSIACMANTNPAIDHPELVSYILAQAKQGCGVHVYPIAALSKGLRGAALTDYAALSKAGVVALSDDGIPVRSAHLLRNAFITAKQFGLPLLSHCEDADLVSGRAVNEGRVSRRLGLPGRPAIAEELMVMRDAMLAAETHGAVHICHVSTRNSVDIIRRAKAYGVPITCETCPQYFFLTEEEILHQGAMAKINPPLRTQDDVAAVIEGLQDGTIDVVASDHAPHSAEEKALPLEEAPSGMVGLETSLGVTLTALYHTNLLSLSDILRKMTVNPAAILRVPAGRLLLGANADITIFDPNQVWQVDPEQFASKGRNTPLKGQTLRGRVKYTLVGGQVIHQDDPPAL